MTDAALPAPAAAMPSPPEGIPWIGLAAVLLGTFISTLTGRLSTFGLADIRGAVHAGFDEGAWITTAQTAAQMLVAPFAVWAGVIYGPRRVLLAASLAFAAISAVLPLSENLPTLLIFQFLGGLASGTFVPLTLSFILRRTPMKYWAYGIAVYTLNLELSLNISASLEGWYVDHLSWRWIFWQNVPLALAMAVCLSFGIAPQTPPAKRQADIYGLFSSAFGLALIYAGLDQGNRLDWISSGLVWGLLLAGAILIAAFVFNERVTNSPWLSLRAAFGRPLPRLLLLVGFLRLTILSTAFLIPQFLGGVRGFRALQVGQTLVWIAIPQLIICPIAAFMLRRSDPRISAGLGMMLVSCACLLVAHNLTSLWGSDQFLLSQLIQAVGQSLALSGIVFLAVLHLRPEDALTFGAMLQVARLMGGELGQAFISTFVRVREQRASNLIGLHVQLGDNQLLQRLQIYSRATDRSGLPDVQNGIALLARIVRGTANLQSIIDGFVAVAGAAAFALLILALVKLPPRTPASHIPLFAKWRGIET